MMPKISVKPVIDAEPKKEPLEMTSISEKSNVSELNQSSGSLKDLINIRSVWKELREESSLHGVQHINFRLYKIRGVIWTLALITMICMLTVTLADLQSAYFSYPTVTKVDVDVAEELSFPAVTICNLNPFHMTKLDPDPVLTQYFLRLSNMGFLRPPINFSDPINAPLTVNGEKGFLENNSLSLSSMIYVCLFKTEWIKCNDYFRPKLTDWGMCYTFNDGNLTLPITTKHTGSVTALTLFLNVDQGSYGFGENMAAGIKIVLHSPGEEPNVRDNGFLVSPGFATYAAVRMAKYKYLGPPYKAFGQTYCESTESPDFKNPLRYHDNYSYFACIKECRYEYIFKRCNCSSHFDNVDTRLCSWQEYMECYKPARDEFDTDIEGLDQCTCPLPCDNTEYETQISSTYFPSEININILQTIGITDARKNHLEVRIFYDSLKYMTVKQLPKYTQGDIVAILGGQLGIFIGASFLTLTEIVEFVIYAAFIFVRKKFVKHEEKK